MDFIREFKFLLFGTAAGVAVMTVCLFLSRLSPVLDDTACRSLSERIERQSTAILACNDSPSCQTNVEDYIRLEEIQADQSRYCGLPK